MRSTSCPASGASTFFVFSSPYCCGSSPVSSLTARWIGTTSVLAGAGAMMRGIGGGLVGGRRNFGGSAIDRRSYRAIQLGASNREFAVCRSGPPGYAPQPMGSSPRAVCVCADADVARVVDGALSGAGVLVDHRTEVPADLADAALLVVDRATRVATAPALRGSSVPVVVVGDNLDDEGLITLMLEAPVSHLI